MLSQAELLHYETQAQNKGLRFILGVDEAGRGPLAGPVVAAAVCLRCFDFKNAINDSKKMSAKAREAAFYEIFEKAYVGIGIIGENAIDIVNILNASHLAMEMAVKELVHRMPQAMVVQEDFCRQVMLLIDGNIFRTQLPYQYRTIIGGDGKSLSIACASIIAKVYRDRILDVYDKVFPQYGFAKHKGYPTQAHRLAIKEHGVSIIHRRSFQGGLMITDSIDHLKRYAVPKTEAILKFIARHDCAHLPDGEMEIEDRQLFVRIMSYVPKPALENRFETHRIYADVQYLVSGAEIMQTARMKDLIPLTEYDSKGDYHFFKTSAATTNLIVQTGEFTVFYPNQPHRPSCLFEGHKGLVKKLVFKVKIN